MTTSPYTAYILYHPEAPNHRNHHQPATHRIVFMESRGNDACMHVQFHYWHPEKKIWCMIHDRDMHLIPGYSMLPEVLKDQIYISMHLTDLDTAKKWWDAFRRQSWVRGD